MYLVRRRKGITSLAAVESLNAAMLAVQAHSPWIRTLAATLEQRLSDIAPLFVIHGSAVRDEAHEARALDAAERWLTFYVSELRRLEDLNADMIAEDTTPAPATSWRTTTANARRAARTERQRRAARGSSLQ